MLRCAGQVQSRFVTLFTPLKNPLNPAFGNTHGRQLVHCVAVVHAQVCLGALRTKRCAAQRQQSITSSAQQLGSSHSAHIACSPTAQQLTTLCIVTCCRPICSLLVTACSLDFRLSVEVVTVTRRQQKMSNSKCFSVANRQASKAARARTKRLNKRGSGVKSRCRSNSWDKLPFGRAHVP